MIWDNINIVRKRPVLKECLAFEQSPVAPCVEGEGFLPFTGVQVHVVLWNMEIGLRLLDQKI